MVKYLLAFLISLSVALILGPLVIKVSKKLKASQTVLHYVKEHESKSGTPTLGGVIFILASLVAGCFFTQNFTLALVALATMFGYGILGFLDDFIKIKFKQNEGLKPYQKVIGQVGISGIVAYFCYTSNLVGSTIFVPFTNITLNLGWGVIPFIILVYLAVTNSVNLTDGLDGLASGVSVSYLIGFMALLFLIQPSLASSVISAEYGNMITLIVCVIGAILGFMAYNIFPAKIFMGDTGSLALGGLIASLAVFTRLELILPLLGIMFVVSAMSVIIQVLHFKRTKKRIFLMAPYHHHLEKKGIKEPKIVALYVIFSLIVGAISLAFLI